MGSARVVQEGPHVLLEITGGDMPAQKARELGRVLLGAAQKAKMHEATQLVVVALAERSRVAQQKDRVLIGACKGLVTHQNAAALGQALYKAAMLADEYANANRIILDQALLTRVGFPLGLSSHPKILEESRKEAAWNSDLRRYLPGGVKATEQFGRPAVFNVPGTSPAEKAAASAAKEKMS